MTPAVALKRIDQALDRAISHLNGNRDTTLDAMFDPQIERLVRQLKQMKLELLTEEPIVGSGNLRHAIADCWPFNSELGELIAAAEEAYSNCKVV